MSNYHVLKTTRHDRAQVAFHISVPDELNVPGVNLRTAVSQSLVAVSQVPWLEADFVSEYAQLQSGEVYEHSIVVQYDGNASNAVKQAAIDAQYNSLIAKVQDEIRTRFQFWGLNRDVV